MLDIHCHLLPGLDDGAPDLQCAVEMASVLAEAGFQCVATSPHMGGGPGGDVTEDRAAEARRVLEQRLHEVGVPLQLLPGGEHHVTPEIFAKSSRGELTPIGGSSRYLLVEFPWGGVPDPGTLLFRLQRKGHTLVLAHPERYGFLQADAAAQLAERGVLLQLEIGSFAGLYGDRASARAHALMRRGVAHILASDLHRPDNAALWLQYGLSAVAQRYGAEAVRRGTQVNPQAVVDDQSPDAILPMVEI